MRLKREDAFIAAGCIFTVVDDDGETITAFPQGGGFRCRIPRAHITGGPDAVERLLESAEWRPAWFGSEWFDEMIQGWLKGAQFNGLYRWNGWAQPKFTRDQVDRFIEQHMAQANADPNLQVDRYEWDEDGETLLCHAHEPWSETPEHNTLRETPTEHDLPGLGRVKCWSIDCHGGMCWNEDEPVRCPECRHMEPGDGYGGDDCPECGKSQLIPWKGLANV
jgi:hypothetical protein